MNIIFISYNYSRRSKRWFEWFLEFVFTVFFSFNFRWYRVNLCTIFPYLIKFSCFIFNSWYDLRTISEVMWRIMRRRSFFCLPYLISSARVTGFRCFFVPIIQLFFTLLVDFYDSIKSCEESRMASLDKILPPASEKDIFVRGKVSNQGGGWCFTIADAHAKLISLELI